MSHPRAVHSRPPSPLTSPPIYSFADHVRRRPIDDSSAASRSRELQLVAVRLELSSSPPSHCHLNTQLSCQLLLSQRTRGCIPQADISDVAVRTRRTRGTVPYGTVRYQLRYRTVLYCGTCTVYGTLPRVPRTVRVGTCTRVKEHLSIEKILSLTIGGKLMHVELLKKFGVGSGQNADIGRNRRFLGRSTCRPTNIPPV